MSYRIEHRLGIAAPAAEIWAVLADIEAWPSWNPLYPHAQGRLKIGEQLTLTERAGGRDVSIAPTIVDWVPEEQVLWRLGEAGGFIRRLRFLEIESLAEESCIFSTGEIWNGRLAFTARQRRRDLRVAYASMADALSAQVLRRWRLGAAPPI